ncbi:MAG: DNA polymerase III subunit [Thermoleophilia bacterium]
MFADIPGQARAKAYVAGALERGAGHAYLLAGPEGLGKRRFARELGAALVAACGGCGHCDECERLARGVHPDLTVIEREGEFIRIGQIAELIADLALKPFSATHRVWVIVEPERMNVEAANTFLKSLEEPPAQVHFILVSDEPERLLPTIVSRCQVVEFQPVADAELVEFLVAHEGLDAERATVVARLAHGSLERALRLAGDDRGPQHRQRYLRLAAGIVLHDRDAEHSFVDEVGNAEAAAAAEIEADIARRRTELERTVPDERERAYHARRLDALLRREQARVSRLATLDALDHLSSFVRDVWAVGLGAAGAVSNRDRLAELEHAAVARPDIYARLLEAVGRTRKDLSLNIDRRLALQAMFARFQEVWESA